MRKEQIIQSIQNWQLIKNDPEKLVSYFGQGNCFVYDLQSDLNDSHHLHVYPGIHEDQLNFFIIPENYDKPEYAETIEHHVEVRTAMWLLKSHQIDDLVARERIHLWEQNYPVWVPQQVETPEGIFLAFIISIQDFIEDQTDVILGLKPVSNAEGNSLKADMIVSNYKPHHLVYEDFVQPVPPFGATSAISDFYLLEASWLE